MSHGAGTPLHSHCQNCGTPLQGPYCSHCGQHDFDTHQSFRHVLFEALEDFFHFDTKLFRTLGTLLFRPGQLSAEFNAGKRAAQMPPFRLYIFVSVLFFFVSLYSGPRVPPNQGATKPTAPGKVTHSVGNGWLVWDTDEGAKPAASSSTRAAPKPAAAAKQNAVVAWFERNGERAFQHPEELTHLVMSAVPKLFLICVPGFALLTWLMFRRAEPAYLAHLVVALHFHSFVYLWQMVGDGWVFLLGGISPILGRVVGDVIGLWLLIYPFRMLRLLFKNPWRWTLLKGFALFIGYYSLLLIVFVVTAAIIIALI